jgi:esterase/lipase
VLQADFFDVRYPCRRMAILETRRRPEESVNEVSAITAPTLIVAAGKEKIGQASAYEEMNQRIAGSELLYYDTAHNICDGYATHCIEDLMTFLRKHP